MTAQFWLWVVLSGLGGGIAGWWIRGRRTSGREMTIKREFDNRLSTVEDDARRSLERARTESDAHARTLSAQRDVLYAQLSAIDPGGTWRAGRAAAINEPESKARARTEILPSEDAESDATRGSVTEPEAEDLALPSSGPAPDVSAFHRSGLRPRKQKRTVQEPGASANGAPSETTDAPTDLPRPERRDRDDLKLIKGIGPTFERQLNEMGYLTFRDLAEWGPRELDELTVRLGSRIRLTEWSGQAARLHRDKYGART